MKIGILTVDTFHNPFAHPVSPQLEFSCDVGCTFQFNGPMSSHTTRQSFVKSSPKSLKVPNITFGYV